MSESNQPPIAPSAIDESKADPPTPSWKTPFFRFFLGLHLLIILLNIVPLFYYFQRSWELTHYQFFPVALLIFGYMIYQRMDRGELRDSWSAMAGNAALLLFSTFCFALSITQYNHYLPVVGVVFAIGGLLIRLKDKESDGSLFPIWFLLIPLIRVPLNFDLTLITELQFYSAWFASNVLDFVGIPNFTPGTVIQVANQGVEGGVRRFDVERACSGVQSLFTLLFCTVTVAVWGRRSIVKGLLLVLSGVFWSVTMNGIRIVICVAFYYWFNLDVFTGIPHEILGYLILFAAIGLISSTDTLLSFLLGPIDLDDENQNTLKKLWNRYVAGLESLGRKKRRQRRRRKLASQVQSVDPLRPVRQKISLSFLAVANLCGLFVLMVSFSGENRGGTFQVDALGLVATDLPEQLAVPSSTAKIWVNELEDFRNVLRPSNSTYGPNSSTWVYKEENSNLISKVSLDYPFLGWHELRVCYQGSGWTVERIPLVAKRVPEEYQESVKNWQPIEMKMKLPNGEYGYCIFSIFDYQSNSVEPLIDKLGFFILRLRNRIAREFSTTTTFQVQCFHSSFNEISDEKIAAIRLLHLRVREQAKNRVMQKLKNQKSTD